MKFDDNLGALPLKYMTNKIQNQTDKSNDKVVNMNDYITKIYGARN